MAGFSTLRDVNCVDYNSKIRVHSVNVDCMEEGNDDEDWDRILISLFEHVLVVILKNNAASNAIRPCRKIDLFRLFYSVRERGGLDSVSREKLWGMVTECLDLDSRFSASLKLIYFKYLDELDRCLIRIGNDGNFVGRECGRDLELISIEFAKRFNGLAKIDHKVMNKLRFSGVEKGTKLKRKSQDWLGMLSWLKRVAMNPRGFRLLENGGNESRDFALLARGVLLKRSYVDSKDDGCSSNQKKQRMHPTFYNDPASPQGESVRFSKRVSASAKTPRCSCCDPSSTKATRLAHNCKSVSELNCDPSPNPAAPNPSEPAKIDRASPDSQPVEKSVNVGPQYQAEIPPCTGIISYENCENFGTRIWPPESWEENNLLDFNSVLGKGRPESCNCPFPGSVECVRFHTAESKLKLKRELGQAFYEWKFDKMGEVVSLGWTPEEEERFKSVMSTTPIATGKSSFPKKTVKEFMDYYFNVFLQRKRSYQNRVRPNSIDSDDELTEFGSCGGLYGNAAINASRNPSKCVLNEQRLDLDETENEKKR